MAKPMHETSFAFNIVLGIFLRACLKFSAILWKLLATFLSCLWFGMDVTDLQDSSRDNSLARKTEFMGVGQSE